MPLITYAGNHMSVSPVVIDEKAYARDILKETLTLTNKTGSRLKIYAIVNDVNPETGKEAFESVSGKALAGSLANWIEISRGVILLDPGKSIDIPVTIGVNLNAKPGDYHALISFSTGSTRKEAEDHVGNGESVAVNIEVIKDIKEHLQLGAFSGNKVFFSGPDVSFSYNLENTGNADLSPTGEVRIYDRRGHEVGSVPANIDNTIIKPSETGQLASVWNAGTRFGRYKAFLDLSYGDQSGTVNDTIFFWIIPWKIITVVFVLSVLLIGGGTYMLYTRYEQKHKLARVRARNPIDRPSRPAYAERRSNTPPSEKHVIDMRT